MNVFHLSRDPEKSARFHCDKHIVKMILEYAQLLSTANRLNDIDEGYKVTHKNHPCAIWARHSLDNWLFLRELAFYCNKEFRYRYGHVKNHKSYDVISSLSVPDIPKLGLTRPPLCMPDDVKLDLVIPSYRNYYKVYKREFAYWTKRDIPKFMLEKQ